ncbi:MAG: threonine synthase [Lachnospiraceae bacterium]|nr:threonine synthase [Lachnospiraceae bacterium]
MSIIYHSTRSKEISLSASEAILQGLSPDGGLFVPDRIPALPKSLDELKELDYRELAFEIMSLFFDDFTKEELSGCIERAYDSKFDDPKIAPIAKVGDVYYLELFHGATIAFKDMALSILPHLMTTAAKKHKIKDEIVILTATSGDTGKAALAGFSDVPGTRIIVFYPKDGVSRVQELQMITQKGDNTAVVGIRGNFDDAQTGVKAMFHDEELLKELSDKGFRFSSANSINIGRLVPQIVYYIYAYCTLLKEGEISAGEKVNFTVPTGNFGNILAAYYAGRMGLPVGKLICASNENKVLYDFFQTGTYDRNREFFLTSSPSMDILISSNLERLIHVITGEDPDAVRKLMEELSSKGSYTVTPAMREKLGLFYGGYASEEECAEEIRRVFEDTSYVLDPHTAVASSVLRSYRKETGDNTPTVIASTASPYKFTKNVMKAMGEDCEDKDDFELMEELSRKSLIPVPDAVRGLKDAPIRHTRVCDRDAMRAEVGDILGLSR